MRIAAAFAIVIGVGGGARADDPAPAEAPAPAPAPAPVVAPAPAEAPEPDPRIDELEQRLEELEDHDIEQKREIARLTHGAEAASQRVEDLAPIANMLSVYVDAGFFVAGGDGSGVRPDLGHQVFADYAGRVPAKWVLMGDSLATAINARGEPADLGDSRAITDDAIDSEGHPAFIANTIGLGLQREIGGGIGLATRVELLPRGHDARFDVQTAAVTYSPRADGTLLIAAGKVDSVLGVEYRTQDAPDRLTVTPSLACRYTCGRPLGVQVRHEDKRWSVAVAITEGDNFQQGFEPDDRLVSTTLPTLSTRASVTLPVGGPSQVILGASAAVGPQDRQPDDDLTQWHYGFDARLRRFHDIDVTAEWVQGRLPGAQIMNAPDTEARCQAAECLRYRAAYGLVSWRANLRFQPYARVDWRKAVQEHGGDFVYIANEARLTAGVRVMINRYATAKIEYTANRELGRIPDFPDDVLTTSVVVSTD